MAKIRDAVEQPNGPSEKKPSSAGSGLFAFTMDASTGQITTLEKVESAGEHRQLSELEKTSLQSGKSWHTLEAIIEQAFEAGIGCVLGNEDERDAAQESEDEADVRRTLLQALIEQTRTKTLLQRSVLGQAILATALQQVTAAQASEAETGSAQQNSGAAAAAHPPSSAGPEQH
jgi:hypothetical protein